MALASYAIYKVTKSCKVTKTANEYVAQITENPISKVLFNSFQN